MKFSANTTVHFPDRDPIRYLAGDTIPDDVLPFVREHLIQKDNGADEIEDNYDKVNVRGLLTEAQERGLEVTSTKRGDLVSLLREDDAVNLR